MKNVSFKKGKYFHPNKNEAFYFDIYQVCNSDEILHVLGLATAMLYPIIFLNDI